jgi:hypothetical protein
MFEMMANMGILGGIITAVVVGIVAAVATSLASVSWTRKVDVSDLAHAQETPVDPEWLTAARDAAVHGDLSDDVLKAMKKRGLLEGIKPKRRKAKGTAMLPAWVPIAAGLTAAAAAIIAYMCVFVWPQDMFSQAYRGTIYLAMPLSSVAAYPFVLLFIVCATVVSYNDILHKTVLRPWLALMFMSLAAFRLREFIYGLSAGSMPDGLDIGVYIGAIVAALAVSGCVFGAIKLIGRKKTGKTVLGDGDFLLLMCASVPYGAIVSFASCFVQAVVQILGRLFGNRDKYVAMAPAICITCFAAMVYMLLAPTMPYLSVR